MLTKAQAGGQAAVRGDLAQCGMIPKPATRAALDRELEDAYGGRAIAARPDAIAVDFPLVAGPDQRGGSRMVTRCAAQPGQIPGHTARFSDRNRSLAGYRGDWVSTWSSHADSPHRPYQRKGRITRYRS